MKKKQTKSIAFGIGIGATNAIFGGGGGMLAVPALRLLGHEEKQAHATAIAVILPVSALSFLWYLLGGLYDVNVLIPTAFGTVVGGLLGAKLLGLLPKKAVSYVFAALQALAGFWLFFA
ncbi:MAG: sulfite exporter TauE/SafE family protein [Clostridia bacterium]|nr:sulfite exporter TauE/SafE family protein [Clostridia bacterium]